MVKKSTLIRFVGTIAGFINITRQLSISPVIHDGPTNLINSRSGQLDQRAPAARPFYVIAHRVLMSGGIDDALRDGANAVEIDMTAYKEGWWADHDHAANSWGDSALDIFHHIAQERQNGKSITFVWLDIKNPDWCDTNDPKWQHCSVGGLRDLARQILQPVGVRVLYGYILGANSKTYPFIRDGLNSNEAINLDGNPKQALQRFESGGPTDNSRRVSSYGDDDLPHEFGNCEEDSYYTCTELRQAVGTGKFGKVFGWTATIGQGDYVAKELDIAGVDGIIYGFKGSNYDDTTDARAAANDIIGWVIDHSDRRFIATSNDPPW
ncbi:MAG: hypothetical protein L6R37_000146 [Teloschistes peruensis]|nr:MAG: hypothetical protein L6R37_000146 [Teloschistes peruensis]